MLRVEFQAVALEPLHLERLAFNQLFVLVGNWEAKYW
jgi:hypothetical protein